LFGCLDHKRSNEGGKERPRRICPKKESRKVKKSEKDISKSEKQVAVVVVQGDARKKHGKKGSESIRRVLGGGEGRPRIKTRGAQIERWAKRSREKTCAKKKKVGNKNHKHF